MLRTTPSGHRGRYVIVPVALAMLVTLAGCGSGSDAESGPRTVQVATAAESKPLSWGAIGHKPQGYEPEVLQAIDKKLPDYKFHIEGAADIAEETGLATGKYDMIAGGYYRNPNREKQFLIPENPSGASLMKIYVRSDSDIKSLEDLVGKRIVPATAGGGVYNFLTEWQKQNPDHKLDIKTSSAGIPYPDRLKEVASGKYDAMVLPSNLGEATVIKQQNLPIKASEPIDIQKTYLLLHKSAEGEKLVKEVDKALGELREDGTLSKLSQKWFEEDVFTYVK